MLRSDIVSEKCYEVVDYLRNLSENDKCNAMAIILNHYKLEQVLDYDGDSHTPPEVGFDNADEVIISLFAKTYSGKEINIMVDEPIEQYIEKNDNINKIISSFYSLNADEKIDFIVEILFIVSSEYKIRIVDDFATIVRLLDSIKANVIVSNVSDIHLDIITDN